MAKPAPNPIDVQDFQFKLHCRLKVFDNEATSTFSQPCNLISVASQYGLVFVGSVKPTFQIIQISSIEKHVLKESGLTDYSCRTIPLPSPPKYLDVNCDNTKLAVVVEKNRSLVALIFDVLSMLKLNLPPPTEIILSSSSNVHATQTNWNPAIPNIFTVCKSDGSLGVFEFKNSGVEINQLPGESQAMCFSWSPKGKQIAVGARNGTITQYKPDLKAVKIINAPPMEGLSSVVALQWISNYLFIGLYKPQNGESACLITIEAPRAGNPVYANYDDICYSYGNARPIQFYMVFQSIWNTLMVASSNSMEVGVLGCESEQWTQWILGDSARAELPLSAAKQETVPIGLAFDIAAVDPVVWGETSLPPAPFLLLLSHQGLLCCFRAINMKSGVASICQPPQQLADTSGLSQFTNVITQPKPSLNIPTPQKEVNVVSSSSEKSPGLKIGQQPSFNVPATSLFQPQIHSQFFTPKPEVTPLKQPQKAFNLPTTGFSQLQGFDANKSEQPISFKVDPNAQQSLLTSLLQDNRSPNMTKAFNMPPQQPPLTSTPFSRVITAELPKPSPNDKPINLPASVTITPIPKVEPQVKDVAKENISAGELNIATEDANVLIAKLIREECDAIDVELRALLQKGLSLKVDIGTDKEASKLVSGTDELSDFLKDITETNSAQSAEIHSLKQGLIQTWAWYEDARSRYSQAEDATLETLLRVQQLDPVSQRYLNEMKHMTYYLESQLMQASRSLDEQWENFQDACKKVSRLKIPTMEAIYQTMVRQSAIFQKQKFVLKDVSQRIRSNSNKVAGTSLLISLNNADNLEKELKRLQLHPECWLQSQYERVVQNKRNLTDEKVKKLRELLINRKITRGSANKPQLFNKSLQLKLQASMKTKTSGFSPISENKQLEPRVINFNKVVTNEEKSGLTISKVPVIATPVAQPHNQSKPDQPSSFKWSTTSSASSMKPTQTSFNFANTNTATMFTTTPFSVSNILSNESQTGTSPLQSFKLSESLSTSSASTTLPNVTSGQLPKSTSSAFAPTTQLSFNFNTKSSTSNTFSSVTPTNASKSPFTFEALKSTVSNTSNTFTPTTTSVVVVTSATPVLTSETSKSQSVVTSTAHPSTTFKFSKDTVPGQNVISALQYTPATSNSSLSTLKSTSSGSSLISSAPTFAAPKTSFSFATPSKPLPGSLSEEINKSSPKTQFMFGNAQNIAPASTLDNKSAGGLFSDTTTSVKADQPALPLAVSDKNPPKISTDVSTSASNSISTFMFGSGTSSALSFGAANTTAQTNPLFGTTSSGTSIFSGTPAKSEISGTGSIFETRTETTTSPVSVFGNTVTSSTSESFSSPIVTTSSSIFGVPSVTTAISFFGSTSGSLFGTPTEKLSAADSTEKTTSGVTTVIASNATPIQSASVVSNSMFNNSVETITPPSSPAVSSTAAPVFKAPPISVPVIQKATSTSLFGGPASTPFFNTQPAASTTSVFSGSATSTTPIFGSATLGTANTTPTVFPQAPPSTNSGSIFGAPPSGGLFGSAASPTSKPTTFGFGSGVAASTTTATTTTGSLFGQPAMFQSGSLFNTPAAPNNAFGSSAFGTNQSIFGSPTTVANEAKPASSFSFATAAANVSTNPSVFGTSTQPAFGFGSMGSNSDTSSFGFGNLNVQNSTTTSSAPFGTGFGQQANSNPFGKATQEKPAFGAGNMFAKANTTSPSSIFGGGTSSTFGSSPVFGSSPGFGSPPAFGQQPAFSQSSFGGGFGSAQQTGPFSGSQPTGASGPFSTGNQSVSQTGFGGFGQAQKPSGFGSAPVFGGSPGGFGSPPAFGSTTGAFGANSSFGSPSIPSGGGGAFGAPTESSTFANLATQNTLGFGSLAQQTQTNPGMSSFSGGSSFSTWR